MAPFSEITAKCEAYIRKGQLSRARALLLSLPLNKIPKDKRLALARFARRAGPLYLGFRLLHPMLDARKRNDSESAEIVAEYAVMLIQNGNHSEALRLLEKMRLDLHPDLLLAKAWAHFERWEYRSALPLLRDYVARKKDPYLNLAGRVNLAEACHAEEKLPTALKLLNEVIAEAEQKGHTRLLGNGLHLRARVFVGLRELEKSDRDLERAMRLFGRKEAPDAGLIRRQTAINQALKAKSVKPLLSFREEAVKAEEWESVRECDFQMLKIRFQRALFQRLYRGTPYPAFRERMEKEFGKLPLPPHFLWGTPGAACLDLSQKTFPYHGKEVAVTRQNRALLQILVRDSYRPVSVGGIFAGLFPSEHYDPALSPVRVHQGLKRLRQWLAQAKIPLALECRGSWYFLRRKGDFSIRVPVEQESLSALLSPRDHIAQAFPVPTLFSAAQARQRLGLPKATVTRYLAALIASGALEKMGRGKATKYRYTGTA
jgi:tetratricopeptide (TPR) repeat protein